MGYLEEYNRLAQRLSFSDARHPLKPDGWELMREWADGFDYGAEEWPDGITPPASPFAHIQRVRAAYELWHGLDRRANTKQAWADATSRGRNQPGRWLKDPSTMTAEDVAGTCELFGCTLEYLRGWDASPTGRGRRESEPLRDWECAYYYRRLTPKQQQEVSELILRRLRDSEQSRRIEGLENGHSATSPNN